MTLIGMPSLAPEGTGPDSCVTWKTSAFRDSCSLPQLLVFVNDFWHLYHTIRQVLLAKQCLCFKKNVLSLIRLIYLTNDAAITAYNNVCTRRNVLLPRNCL